MMIVNYIIQQRNLKAPLLLLCLTLSSCSNFGPYIDQPEPDTMAGPGLFTGEQGYISILDKRNDSNTFIDPVSTSDSIEFTEFKLYKDWRKMKLQGDKSVEYREFLLWLEFQKIKSAQ